MPTIFRVDLYQDNGGQLYALAHNEAGNLLGGWSGFERLEAHTPARQVAEAILCGNTGDFTLPILSGKEAAEIVVTADLIAICGGEDGWCEAATPYSQLGAAARAWFTGAEMRWTEARCQECRAPTLWDCGKPETINYCPEHPSAGVDFTP